MAKTWSAEQIEELINLVQEKDAIWTASSKMYHDRDKRKDAVREISEKLEITEEEFKRKWNSLRTQFTQEKTKKDKSTSSGSGTAEVYTPKWCWFERLKFLWDVIGPKKTISNLPLPCEPDEDEIVSNDLDESINSNAGTNSEITSNSNGKPPNTKRSSAVQEEELKMLQQATSFLQGIKKPKSPYENKEDELDVFGRHIANELRLIKDANLLRLAKHKINNIIFESQSSVLASSSETTNTTAETVGTNAQSSVGNTPFWGSYGSYIGNQENSLFSL